MRVRWRGLELPTKVVRDEETGTDQYGRFTIEPFERGFGTTVGNSLRRILLSSLEGAAVTRVKIAGAPHEFSSLPGVLEDVTDIILNIKSLVVRFDGDEPKTMRVARETKGAVRGGDIEADPAIEVLNKDLLLATLTEDVPFEIEMTVAKGRGYIPAEETIEEEQEIGVIPIDAVFSPVTRVRYKTEDTRVGRRTNYDRLILEVWTKGTVTPEMALVEAARILRKHLNAFVQYFELGEERAGEPVEVVTGEAEADPEMLRKLNMNIQDLELSVRAGNCLVSAKINTVADLVQMAEVDLLKFRNFGKTSLREVKRKLADLGLSLGMDLTPLKPQLADSPSTAEAANVE
mgnify:CR=1 FL=1